MKKENFIVNGEAMTASQENVLVVEQFLTENYMFRRNILNGKVEFAKKVEGEEAEPAYRPLTQEALNSIVLRALREEITESNPKSVIQMIVSSEDVPQYNPIGDFLEHLPAWDGQNHVTQLFSRLPGITSEQAGFLATWLRSTVAHWLQMDILHGNECVPVLIGAQGCGKTTFLRRLLPANLRQYYLDHLNLSNKFDKAMALTNNLLVNLDELDAIRPSQHASLKQTLSKSKVNGRPIYGASQEDRPRYASFVATTNNPHPLTDATGSRRYICLTIPQGKFIDNAGNIDYEQLYAQVLHELRVDKAPYWFNNDEVARIQQLNQNYQEKKDLAEMISSCFRKPKSDEDVKPISSTRVLQILQSDYTSLSITQGAKVNVGRAMRELGVETISHGNVAHYKVVPLKSA